MPLATASRRKALEAGLWETSAGDVIPIGALHDAHLINALLKTLGEGRPEREVRPLAAEVVRRGLNEAAMNEAAAREGRRQEEEMSEMRFVAIVDANHTVIGVRESSRRQYTHAVIANKYQGVALVKTDAVISYHTTHANAEAAARGLNAPGRFYRWTDVRIVPAIETPKRAKLGAPLSEAFRTRTVEQLAGFNNRHED